MRRSAKILCAFGSTEIFCATMALLIFDHITSPWGVGTLPGGLGETQSGMEKMMWQSDVQVSFLGAGFLGVSFLLAGGVTYLISRLTP